MERHKFKTISPLPHVKLKQDSGCTSRNEFQPDRQYLPCYLYIEQLTYSNSMSFQKKRKQTNLTDPTQIENFDLDTCKHVKILSSFQDLSSLQTRIPSNLDVLGFYNFFVTAESIKRSPPLDFLRVPVAYTRVFFLRVYI